MGLFERVFTDRTTRFLIDGYCLSMKNEVLGDLGRLLHPVSSVLCSNYSGVSVRGAKVAVF
jgi:hypothetical protein